MKTFNTAAIMIAALALTLVTAARAQQNQPNQNAQQDQNAQQNQTAQQQNQNTQQPQAGSNEARVQSQAKANQQAEQQRKDAEQQAQQTLDKEAAAAIQETAKAVQAIDAGRNDEAIAALERATGKINVLTARNPATALIPAAVTVEVIDTAPLDVNEIKRLGKAAERAVDDRDFPTARVILGSLISELRVRTYNIPLVTYPIAMQDAARMLDQKKTQEAKAILQMALNTLAVIDHVKPLPILTAQAAIEEAQAQRDKNKDEAKKLLAASKMELDRARELGYAGKDPEYAALTAAIDEVQKQIDGGNSTSAFANLKEKVASFFRRQSESGKNAQVASR